MEAAERFPDLPLEGVDTSGLGERDAALARAIDQAVRRRWLTLASVLERRLDQPHGMSGLESAVQAALLAGAAQLLLFDRVPDHAVLHETVEWAKRRVRPGAGRLVNAVLRAVAEMRNRSARLGRADAATEGGAPALATTDMPLANGEVLRFGEPIFPTVASSRLARQTSHAELLTGRWLEQFGYDVAQRVALHGIAIPPVLIHGQLDAVAAASVTPHARAGFHVFTGPTDRLGELLRANPRAWVQDPGSADAVAATHDRPAELAVDLCAGKGTKTRQLTTCHPAATIIASDPDPQRLAALRASAASSPRVQALAPSEVDAAVRRARPAGADLVLADVPCSNTGVLARRLEARYRFDAARLAELVRIQREILRQAAALLAPGGRLLYATCSLEPEENEGQWTWAASALALTLIRSRTLLPEGGPGRPAAQYADGGGWALFEKA